MKHIGPIALACLIAGFGGACSDPDSAGTSPEGGGSAIEEGTENPLDPSETLADSSGAEGEPEEEEETPADSATTGSDPTDSSSEDDATATETPDSSTEEPNDTESPQDASPSDEAEDTVLPSDSTGEGDGLSEEEPMTDASTPEGDAGDEEADSFDETDSSDGTGEPLPEPDVPVEPDAGETELEVLAQCPGTVQFFGQAKQDFALTDTEMDFKVTVAWTGEDTPEAWEILWEDQDGTVLGQTPISWSGSTWFSQFIGSFDDPGKTQVRARLTNGEQVCESGAETLLNLCKYQVMETFNTGVSEEWTLQHDANWISGPGGTGWVELTGIGNGKKGVIFNDSVKVTEGRASIRMTFATGGGVNSGADGMAMTILDVETVQEMADYIASAATGGGLGFATSGFYGDWVGSALHVEVDTWYNEINGAELHTDPTTQNHVAISLDGNPGDFIAWSPIPSVEDLQWHTIRVDVDGTLVDVFFDGVKKAEENSSALDFRGGFVFFSASTGWASNYHRVQSLEILHGCQ